MNATQAHPPVKKDPYSFSLKKIIQDVEERTGRRFSGGTEDLRSSSPKRHSAFFSPEPDHARRGEPRYPRATRQLCLEGTGALAAAQPAAYYHDKGAGRASGYRSAPPVTEHPSARKEENHAGPEYAAPPRGCDVGHVSVVLSLLPQVPRIGDEAFLFLYLNLSGEFERRFGVPGWCDRVLTMAAQGRK